MTNTAPPNKNTAPMVTASIVTLGGSATTIILYIIQSMTGDALPEPVSNAVLVVVSAALAFISHRVNDNS
jgi:hypothetical protein